MTRFSSCLRSATAKSTEGNSLYGLAIGFAVMAGVFAVGGISGGVFNPAVAVGISIGLSSWVNIWVYLLANFSAAAAAALVFKLDTKCFYCSTHEKAIEKHSAFVGVPALAGFIASAA